MGTGVQAAPSAVVEAGARFVGLNKDAPNFPDVVAGLKAVGLRVLVWTVDMQQEYDDVMAAGCDGIFTNEPLYAAAQLRLPHHRRPRGPSTGPTATG